MPVHLDNHHSNSMTCRFPLLLFNNLCGKIIYPMTNYVKQTQSYNRFTIKSSFTYPIKFFFYSFSFIILNICTLFLIPSFLYIFSMCFLRVLTLISRELHMKSLFCPSIRNFNIMCSCFVSPYFRLLQKLSVYHAD